MQYTNNKAMNIQELQTKLRTIPQLKDFMWKHDNYGTLDVGNRDFKDSGKNGYLLGSYYSIFLTHMYEGQPNKEFFYVIIERPSEKREFRKHSFYYLAWNKRFISGDNVEIVIQNIKELFANDHDPYKFL
tara:strand:- start:668 stop:1057 length:390 start_codon:yes stop_codon:yes gene_type:complete